MAMIFNPSDLLTKIDFATGALSNQPVDKRYLSDLQGCFADQAACHDAIERENPLVYSVSSMTRAEGEGQLHYGLGVLYPGKIGNEYFMTKGHLHAWRSAAEVYVGLKGEGYMLLEQEQTRKSLIVSLCAGEIVYVPGNTAHRTINVGRAPLVYLGVYPWDAGHDYGAIAERNFLKVLVDRDGKPTLIDRSECVSAS